MTSPMPQSLGGELTSGLTDDFQITFTDDLVSVKGIAALDDALGTAATTLLPSRPR